MSGRKITLNSLKVSNKSIKHQILIQPKPIWKRSGW